MKMRSIACLASAVSVCALVRCAVNTDVAGTTSETSSGVISAQIYYADNRFTSDAEVAIFESGDTTQKPVSTTRTDFLGRVSLGSVNARQGYYNLWIEKDTLVAFLDSILVSADSNTFKKGLVAAPVSYTGVVVMEPNHSPTTVSAQILGTYLFANVSADGRFSFDNIAAGTYRLRLISTNPDYPPLYQTITVTSATQPVDSITMIFTGIPVARDIHGIYDTLAGTATIVWKPTTYPYFSELEVFRDKLPDTQLSTVPIATTRDTSYTERFFDLADTLPLAGHATATDQYRYRVRIRNTSTLTGPFFNSVDIVPVDPSAFIARLNYRFVSLQQDSTIVKPSLDDTVRLIATASHPRRALTSISWSIPANFTGGITDSLLHTLTFQPMQAELNDTVVLAFSPSILQGDSTVFICRITDNAQVVRTLIIPVTVDMSTPTVSGLQAVYDTLSGSAQLTWNRSRYRYFDNYAIYRDGSFLTTTTDTIFSDPLVPLTDTLPLTAIAIPAGPIIYQLRVINTAGDTGAPGAGIEIMPVDPTAVIASLSFQTIDPQTKMPLDSIFFGDTISLAVTANHPRRPIFKIEWYLPSDSAGTAQDSLLKTTSFILAGTTRQDTLALIADKSLFRGDSIGIQCRITDSEGVIRTLLFFIRAHEPLPFQDTAQTLVAFYDFTGSLTDRSGHGNELTAAGGSYVADRYGNPGQAYGFDGVPAENYASNESPTALPTSDTVPKSICGWATFGAKGTVCQTFYDCDFFGFGSPSDGTNFSLGIDGAWCALTVWGWGNDWHTTVSPVDIPAGWHHYAVTTDNIKTILYIDGVARDSTSFYRWNTGDDRIIIGNEIDQGSHELEGAVDDVRIYRGCLSAAQVNALFREGD